MNEKNYELLKLGKAPSDLKYIEETTVGLDNFVNFWINHYLIDFVSEGGSKIKFLTGKKGCGKTHFLNYFRLKSEQYDFLSVSFSAREVWINDIKNIYMEVFSLINFDNLIKQAALQVIINLGYNPSDIPEDQSFVSYLVANNEYDPLIKKSIRQEIQMLFIKNRYLEQNFARSISFLVSDYLGFIALDETDKVIIKKWLSGEDLKIVEIRSVGLLPIKITKLNARNLLRSLIELVKISGHKGLIIVIDDLEMLINSSSLEQIRYTKLRRNDAYECIRELIDDFELMQNAFFIFAFNHSLLDEEKIGLKSYQALWMRIQNEVTCDNFNKFTDLFSLDHYIRQNFTLTTVFEISRKIINTLKKYGITKQLITKEKAEEILAKWQFSKYSLPYLVVMETLKEEEI